MYDGFGTPLIWIRPAYHRYIEATDTIEIKTEPRTVMVLLSVPSTKS